MEILLTIMWLCWTTVTAHLSREFRNSGAHRELVSRFDIPAHDIEIHERMSVACTMLFIETIPSGAYVDPYQLAALRPYGGPDFHLEDTVDLEKPEFLSKEFKLHIFSNLTLVDNAWSCLYSLPIHLRYHAVSVENFHVVKFQNPEIYLRCFDTDTKINYQVYKGESVREMKAVRGSSSNWLCDWTQLSVEMDSEELQVEMPIGKEDHFLIVTMGTILATVSGCMFLIYKTVYTNVEYKLS